MAVIRYAINGFNFTHMTMHKNNEGSLIITELVTDGRNRWLEDRVFQGYTKKEALQKYRLYLRENNLTIVK